MATPQSDKEIQEWMEDVAKRQQPKKKLIFDKKTRRLVAVSASDPRADENLQFTPEEATRFGGPEG